MASTEALSGKILIANEDVFKRFVVEEIKAIADPDSADSDVLADYVFALVQSEKSLDTLRGNFMENLDDFLGDNTSKFAEKLLTALATGSYDPSLVAQQQKEQQLQKSIAAASASLGNENSHIAQPSLQSQQSSLLAQMPPLSEVRPNAPPSGPRAMMRGGPAGDGFKPPSGPSAMMHGQMNYPPHNRLVPGRKRERDRSVSVDPSDPNCTGGAAGSDDRTHKQMRRMGGPNGPRGKPQWYGHPNQHQQQHQHPHSHPHQQPPQQQHQQLQQPHFDYGHSQPGGPMADMNGNNGSMMYPGFPMLPGQQLPFDPAMMQAMMSMGMEGFPAQLQALLAGMLPAARSMPKPEEYDPTNASLANGWRGSGQRGGRGGKRGDRAGGRTRADFSSTGPNYDQSITTVVVENIPQENFTEEAIRQYFSEFGTIQELTLQPARRLALVKFDSYQAANKAYSSPKTIFENRFVKVYWYKPETEKTATPPADGSKPNPALAAPFVPGVDLEEIERKQREFKERQAKLQEAEKEKKELELKLKQQEEERKRLMEAINRAQAKQTATAAPAGPVEGAAASASASTASGPVSETEALKAKLKELEQEARQMGLDGLSGSTPVSTPTWGRGGGYRGRFPTRGRGRGRGGFGQPMFSAVRRLDNRPKRISVNVPPGTERDETLRHYLFNNFTFEGMEPHPDRPDLQIVSFKERYMAENFFKAALSEIPNVGKLEIGWVPNSVGGGPVGGSGAGAASDAATGGDGAAGSAPAAGYGHAEDDDANMDTDMADGQFAGASSATGATAGPGMGMPMSEPDYDVADAM